MSFYDVDLYEWPAEQARLLREGRLEEADLETIAEGLEDMSRGVRNELRNRLRQLLVHLLKHDYRPEKRSRSWLVTIVNQRADIQGLLQDNPSVRWTLPELLVQTYPVAVRTAAVETALPQSRFPASCPYTPEQILDSEYPTESLPEA